MWKSFNLIYKVEQYNKLMGGVGRFDQNNNHLGIKIGGKNGT